MGTLSYQTNSRYVQEVDNFFRRLGIMPTYETLREPPASGQGELVRVTVTGFDPFSLVGVQRTRWLQLGEHLG